MVINLPLKDVTLYGILKSSEGMNVPIFKVNYPITQQFIELNRGAGSELYFYFGEEGEDPTRLLGGFMADTLRHAIEVANEDGSFSNRITNIYKFTTGAELFYKDTLQDVTDFKQGLSDLTTETVGNYLGGGFASAVFRSRGNAQMLVSNSDIGSSSFCSLLIYNDGEDYIYPVSATITYFSLQETYYPVRLRLAGTAVLSRRLNFKYIGLDGFNVNNWKIFTVDKLNGEVIKGPVNPYEPGIPSGPGDLPPGTFDDTSDPIPLPSLPSLSAANTGFTRIYNPTLSQVQALARYLWTDQTVIETIWNHIKQYFEDPMQAMIGFNLVPVPVPDAGSEEFALMYLGTGVYMNVAANQFVDVNCGTVELERYYGSALDQSPYTKVHCYLPYIGTVQLDTDEVMGTTLTVNYRVDIVSGSCVASILVDGNVLYQYSGHCAITIPFSSADFSSYVNAAIQVAKLGIAAGANAGMAALASANQEAQQETGRVVTRTTETRNTTRNPTTGRQITRSTQTVVSTTQYPPEESKSETKASFAGLSPANISNTVGQIMSSKPNILHSGSFSGNSGYLGVRRPYLIIERPNMCLPESFQSLNGYPAMITMSLGDCVGYTRVQQVQLTGLWATNPEQAEILELLKGGVIF